MGINEIRPALEAILFAAGDSVETERIAKILGAEPWDVRQAAEQLAREYEENGRGFRLARMENRLQLVTAGEYSDVVRRALEKRAQPKLSPTALEVLAIVAYYQPVTRSYIEQLRGADSSYTVALLSERGLIAPCGRLEAPGRPLNMLSAKNIWPMATPYRPPIKVSCAYTSKLCAWPRRCSWQ